MFQIVGFFLDNFILIGIIAFIIYIYKIYSDLKKQILEIEELFSKTLNKYLEQKTKDAQDIINNILAEYGHVDLIKTEMNRLVLMIEKGIEGTINDKVNASNSLNKFKLSKKIDLEKYPKLKEINSIEIFTVEELEALDNGLLIARKEYNTKAFKYNEKANGFPMQYLTKYLKINSQFAIFEKSKTKKYEEIYEVFEESEPEINSLSVLNRASVTDSSDFFDNKENKK